MFFFKLKDNDLQLLLKVAIKKKGMPVERLARLAFLRGLRLMAKANAETVVTEVSTEKHVPMGRKSFFQDVQKYILENWKKQTDKQMGEVLGYGKDYIQSVRLGLNLQRRKGRKSLLFQTESQNYEKCSPESLQLDALIHEHWLTKDDWEIGNLMQPAITGIEVRHRRFALGLKKVPGTTQKNRINGTVRDTINAEEFERMVLREGFTMTEYLEFKGLNCSRERLRQVAEQLGLKHSWEDRAPEWKLMRRARKVGHLNLANREWLAEKILQFQSMAALAAELNVADVDLFFFIRSFNLSHPSFRKHGAETVSLVCTTCGTEFSRHKRRVDRRQKNANDQPIEFFCSQSCSGQWNKMRIRKQIEEKSAQQLQRLQAKAEEKERHATFIRENWQSMSDKEMALELGLAVSTTLNRRLKLGLNRR